MNGCGMDMGFHLVYSLSRVLFSPKQGGFECLGIGHYCPSNDHSNAYGANRQEQCFVCRNALNGSELKRQNSMAHEFLVCSEECRVKPWMHSDGGYALRQRWL